MFVVIDSDLRSSQWQTVNALANKFPDKQKAVDAIKRQLNKKGLDWKRDLEPALGPERFFALYCETWRRSVLNLRGRKSVWQWLRQVDLRNTMFLMRALGRTQRMMDPAHYMAEYDLTTSDQSVAALGRTVEA